MCVPRPCVFEPPFPSFLYFRFGTGYQLYMYTAQSLLVYTLLLLQRATSFYFIFSPVPLPGLVPAGCLRASIQSNPHGNCEYPTPEYPSRRP